jgi:hypothetical protein
LTIFDILDRLEARILSLLSPAGAKKKSTAKKRLTRKKKRLRKTARPKGVGEQQELAMDNGAAAAEASRLLGKRQALGRSLLQLRKFSTHRNENNNP